jgi:hypothetical protein
MARKCALLCYFLNTRLESPVKFVHGGVFGRRLNDSYQPGRGQTNYEVVINKTQVLYNTPIFDDENYSEDDFRTAAKMFIEAVAGLSNEYLGFRNFRFLTYAPMVVGSWSVRDSYIDGRYIQLSPLGFRIPSASEYRMLVRPLVPFIIPANRVVVDGNRGGLIGGSQFVDRTVVDYGRVLPGQITTTETQYVNFGRVLPGQYVENRQEVFVEQKLPSSNKTLGDYKNLDSFKHLARNTITNLISSSNNNSINLNSSKRLSSFN